MMNDRNDIVVVDDSPALLSVLSEIFKEHGYTVRKPLTALRPWRSYATENPIFLFPT